MYTSNMQVSARKYKAFTLLEMVVVLGIIILLGTISIFSLSAFRNTSMLRESTANFTLDLQDTQRAAMYLRRDIGERWLYGIGIDLGSFNQAGGNDYTIFRWCSQFDDFDPNGSIEMNSEFPNYDPEESLSSSNGNMPNISGTITKNDTCYLCEGSYCQSELRIDSKDQLTYIDQQIQITISQINGQTPRYILFEAVSGRAFFYNEYGVLLNYEEDGDIVEDAEPIVMTFSISGDNKRKQIIIQPVSGKITVADITE